MNGKKKRRQEDLVGVDWGKQVEGKNNLTQAVSTEQNLPLQNCTAFQGKCYYLSDFPAEEMSDQQTILRDNSLNTFNLK